VTARKPEPVNLTTEELALRLRTSPNAIRIMHTRGTGPESFKRGNRRLYPLPAIEAWERDRTGADHPLAGRLSPQPARIRAAQPASSAA
jgi:hypothetical protein